VYAIIFRAIYQYLDIYRVPCDLFHRIKISNRRATQRCNVSAFFYAKICSLLARRRSSQPVQRVYWPENVIDWLGKWRPTCVMRHARGQKLQSFRRKWPFYMDLYSMPFCCRAQRGSTLFLTRGGFSRVHSTQSFARVMYCRNLDLVSVCLFVCM
jgi:hypothetical protein